MMRPRPMNPRAIAMRKAADRGQGGGRMNDLTGMAGQYLQNQDANNTYSVVIQDRSGRPVASSIVQGNGSDWFGPLNPLNPTAPPEVAGRRFDFMSGYNLQQTPRPLMISAAQLRGFADAYDILRIVIETRKDQMARQQWTIRPRNQKTKMSEGSPLYARAMKIEEFFLRPDKVNFWPTWLRMILEELFVTDAVSIYKRRTRGGDLYALEQIDGGTIAVRLDNWGRTPEPPQPAYQQVLKGLPAIDYTTRDLLYRPRNVRVHKAYGFSPVEQVIMTVNIGLKRQIWQLQYFTEGNIPDSIIGVPDTWTPDQIRNFQDDWDSMMEGNTAMRRRARFVPGDVAKSYVATKDDEIFGAAEEWLARVCCAAMSVSPQPFIKMMNRATAETSVEEAVIDGLAPIMNYVKELVDTILIEEFGETELEFAWQDDKELDPKILSDILTAQASDSIITLNEARGELGLDPDPSPEASRLMLKTPTGWVPVSMDQQIEDKTKNIAAFGMPPAPGQQTEDNGSGEGGGEPKPPVPPKGGSGKDEEGGKPPAKNQSAEVEEAKKFLVRKFGKAEVVPKPISAERALTRTAMRSMEKTVAANLKKTGGSVAEQVKKLIESFRSAKTEATKSDQPEDHGDPEAIISAAEVQAEVDAILKAIDLGDLHSLISYVGDDLMSVFEDSTTKALAQVGVSAARSEELTNRVSEQAVKWADARAAELVGMRKLSDGRLIENPNAKWAIDQSTRDLLRDTITKGLQDNIGVDEIAKNIEQSYAFSDTRASVIANTEVRRANSEGVLQGYREAQDLGIQVQKSWVTVGDADVDEEICQANEDDGPIDLDATFSSGDSSPPGHPNCRCVLVPVVGGGDTGEQLDEEE